MGRDSNVKEKDSGLAMRDYPPIWRAFQLSTEWSMGDCRLLQKCIQGLQAAPCN